MKREQLEKIKKIVKFKEDINRAGHKTYSVTVSKLIAYQLEDIAIDLVDFMYPLDKKSLFYNTHMKLFINSNCIQ